MKMSNEKSALQNDVEIKQEAVNMTSQQIRDLQKQIGTTQYHRSNLPSA